MKYISKISIIAGALLLLFSLSLAGQTALSVNGDAFQVNGKSFGMWGIRVASATMSQEHTDHLIAPRNSGILGN